MSLRWSGWLHALFALLIISSAYAGESVPIGTIVARPESYNVHIVTLQGIARQVEPLGPYVNSDCGRVYDSYKFMLMDDTGSLEVTVPGPCERPPGTMIPVSEGEKVVVEAMIGVVRSDNLPPPVYGIAHTIQRQEGN